MRVICLGNGKSRLKIEVAKLKEYGKVYGCNAIYRDYPNDIDTIISVDNGIMHELYHEGLATKIDCWFRNWTKLPGMMFDETLRGAVAPKDLKEAYDSNLIKENEKGEATEYVMHGATLTGMAKIIKHNKETKKVRVNKTHVYVSWIQPGDKSHSLVDVMPKGKDLGWAAGPCSGYVACKNESPDELYLVGHDLFSSNFKVNNIYAGTRHYVTTEHNPTPAINWVRQWKDLFGMFPETKFIKVNWSMDERDKTCTRVSDWHGVPNLEYITTQDFQRRLDNNA